MLVRHSCVSHQQNPGDPKLVNRIIFNSTSFSLLAAFNDKISRIKTLTASLLLAGYPKAITASNKVVNRHETNFNVISFILDTGSFSGEIPKKVSTLDFSKSASQFFSAYFALSFNSFRL